jgi:hypothetical protein
MNQVAEGKEFFIGPCVSFGKMAATSLALEHGSCNYKRKRWLGIRYNLDDWPGFVLTTRERLRNQEPDKGKCTIKSAPARHPDPLGADNNF